MLELYPGKEDASGLVLELHPNQILSIDGEPVCKVTEGRAILWIRDSATSR